MTHALMELLNERITMGLQRKSIGKCSTWAESYRTMGPPIMGPWTFKYHPWLRDMHDCQDEMIVGQKGAQLGFTETALNKVFYNIDIKGSSVLYILPASNPDASNFSTSRFDPALESSEHLQDLFTDVKNIGHKRAGNANLFIRGSRSRSQLKSIPVGFVVLDEVDEMVEDNIPLVFERMSGQFEKQAFMISTPTLADRGINMYYKNSTQDHFFFRCPHCSRLTELIFPECLVMTSDDTEDKKILDTHLICKECKHPLDHKAKPEWLADAEWVTGFADKLSKGFNISQLYSSTIEPYQLATAYIKGLTNPAAEQEFYNSKLGLTHEVKGARLTEAEINACIGTYESAEVGSGLVTMGIDVGKLLHYEIVQWSITNRQTSDINLKAVGRVLKIGEVLDFSELDLLMRKYNVVSCVIDAHPEKRSALNFSQRFHGRIKMCIYGRGVTSRNISTPDTYMVTVDRTSWLDMSLSRFKNKTIALPVDMPKDYKKHLKALVRIYKEDPDGNLVGKYESTPKEDHYAHAHNYAEIALKLAGNIGNHQTMDSIL